MRKLYLVSYADAAYPRIVETDNQEEGKSFAAAKQEALTSARDIRDHWNEQIRLLKALRPEEVEKDTDRGYY